MVQRTVVILEDDIDGGEATETVTFGLDGVTYEIDLNDKNAADLRAALAPWVGHGRRIARGGRAAAPARTSRKRGSSEATVMREWARANGYTVNDRGRISAEIRAAYEAAH